MISHEARRWLRVVLVEPHEEDVLLLCNWMPRTGMNRWIHTVEDLRIEWSVLGVDAVVLGPSFSHSCPPCTQLKALCPSVSILLAQ